MSLFHMHAKSLKNLTVNLYYQQDHLYAVLPEKELKIKTDMKMILLRR